MRWRFDRAIDDVGLELDLHNNCPTHGVGFDMTIKWNGIKVKDHWYLGSPLEKKIGSTMFRQLESPSLASAIVCIIGAPTFAHDNKQQRINNQLEWWCFKQLLDNRLSLANFYWNCITIRWKFETTNNITINWFFASAESWLQRWVACVHLLSMFANCILILSVFDDWIVFHQCSMVVCFHQYLTTLLVPHQIESTASLRPWSHQIREAHCLLLMPGSHQNGETHCFWGPGAKCTCEADTH